VPDIVSGIARADYAALRSNDLTSPPTYDFTPDLVELERVDLPRSF
jgi:hypothetical protein